MQGKKRSEQLSKRLGRPVNLKGLELVRSQRTRCSPLSMCLHVFNSRTFATADATKDLVYSAGSDDDEVFLQSFPAYVHAMTVPTWEARIVQT